MRVFDEDEDAERQSSCVWAPSRSRSPAPAALRWRRQTDPEQDLVRAERQDPQVQYTGHGLPRAPAAGRHRHDRPGQDRAEGPGHGQDPRPSHGRLHELDPLRKEWRSLRPEPHGVSKIAKTETKNMGNCSEAIWLDASNHCSCQANQASFVYYP